MGRGRMELVIARERNGNIKVENELFITRMLAITIRLMALRQSSPFPFLLKNIPLQISDI